MHVSKKLAALASAILITSVLAPPLMAQSTSWEEYFATGEAPVAVPEGPLFPTNAGGLTFYTDQGTFEADNPDLDMEDFTPNLVPPGGVSACGPFIDSTSNDACFSPGQLIPGFRLSIVPPFAPPTEDMVLAVPPFLGVDCDTVGPNSFADSQRITFNPPVAAAGWENSNPLSPPTTLNIEVFDAADNSLGTTTATATFPPSFFGVASGTDNIARIDLIEASANQPDLLCNLQFGTPPPQEVDLSISKAGPGQVTGGEVEYEICVNNEGATDATGVVVTDALPGPFVSDTCGGMDVPPWTWTIGALGAGAEACCSVVVDVSGVTPGSSVENTAEVAADQMNTNPDGGVSNTVTTTVGTVLDIPTLGQFGILALVLGLLGAGIYRLRRRQ